MEINCAGVGDRPSRYEGFDGRDRKEKPERRVPVQARRSKAPKKSHEIGSDVLEHMYEIR